MNLREVFDTSSERVSKSFREEGASNVSIEEK